MKTRSILFAAIATVAAGAAFATSGEATYEYPQPVASAASRADVRAETLAARAAGQIVSGEASGITVPAGAARSTPRTAVAVVADALPLNAEAMTFDGRALRAQLPAAAPVVAQARK